MIKWLRVTAGYAFPTACYLVWYCIQPQFLDLTLNLVLPWGAIYLSYYVDTPMATLATEQSLARPTVYMVMFGIVGTVVTVINMISDTATLDQVATGVSCVLVFVIWFIWCLVLSTLDRQYCVKI